MLPAGIVESNRTLRSKSNISWAAKAESAPQSRPAKPAATDPNPCREPKQPVPTSRPAKSVNSIPKWQRIVEEQDAPQSRLSAESAEPMAGLDVAAQPCAPEQAAPKLHLHCDAECGPSGEQNEPMKSPKDAARPGEARQAAPKHDGGAAATQGASLAAQQGESFEIPVDAEQPDTAEQAAANYDSKAAAEMPASTQLLAETPEDIKHAPPQQEAAQPKHMPGRKPAAKNRKAVAPKKVMRERIVHSYEDHSCSMDRLQARLKEEGKEHLMQLTGEWKSRFDPPSGVCYFRLPGGKHFRSLCNAITVLEEQWADLHTEDQFPAGTQQPCWEMMRLHTC